MIMVDHAKSKLRPSFYLDRKLFARKLALLALATFALAPLVYFHMRLPAALYVGSLIVLHAAFLVLYMQRTPWRALLRDKAEFSLRLVAVIFFVYLLTLLQFAGSLVAITWNILAALTVHAAILLGMMLVRQPTP